MTTRIVRLHFTEEGSRLFQELFIKHRIIMTTVKGCKSLQLFKEASEANSFVTISQWESNEHLEAYRHSALFVTIWGKLKTHFTAKAEAFSLYAIE